MKQRFLSSIEMKQEMRSYNFALLFNRKNARQLRAQAAKKIYYFSQHKLHIKQPDARLMETYIKTFGFVKHHNVSLESYKALIRLNSEFYSLQQPGIIHRINIGLYNKARRFTRRIAKLFNRYDTISRKNKIKNYEPKKHKKYKNERNISLTKNQQNSVSNTTNKTSWFRQQRNKIVGGLLALGALFGGAKFFQSTEKDNNWNTTTPTETTITPIITPKVIPLTNVSSSKEVNNISTPKDTLAPELKKYYHSALNIHLGETKRNELLTDLTTAANNGKITIPNNESIEHLALVITIARLVQPYDATTKLLNKIQSTETLSAAEQNKIWHFVSQAGERAQNIKGTGNKSNFDKLSPQAKEAHLATLKAARQLKAQKTY